MVSFIYDLSENDRKLFIEYLSNMDSSLIKNLFSKLLNQFDNSLFKVEEEIICNNYTKNQERLIYRFESHQKINTHTGSYDLKTKKPDRKLKPIIRGFFKFGEGPSSYFNVSYTPKEEEQTIQKKGWLSNDLIKIFRTEEKIFSFFKEEYFLGTGEWLKKYRGTNSSEMKLIHGEKIHFKDLTTLKYGEQPFNELKQEYIDFFKKLDVQISEFFKEVYEGVNEFKNERNNVLVDLDKDNNGQLDFIEGGDDYLTLLKTHQSKVIEIDRTYIQQFIKVSNYLTQKKQNLQVIFERLKDSLNQSQLDELGEILKQEIHTYNIILLNSLHMINSLVEDDMITFYDIYEKFDKLNMFTSNWENQVTEKLDEVNLNLLELMKELRDVGNRIVGSIDNLSYITEQSTRQLTSKMEEIDSTLKVGNLINVIQTYQMYKVNKNTKSLRG